MVIDLDPREDPDSIDIFDRNCILIVDEDRESLDGLAASFKQQEFKVLSHTCGNLGMQTAKRTLPDCILVNTELLDMDGFSLCQALVDDSQTCGIPVIMMGKAKEPIVIKKAKAAGSEFFVSKPIDPKAMVFLVNESIAEARSWICD